MYKVQVIIRFNCLFYIVVLFKDHGHYRQADVTPRIIKHIYLLWTKLQILEGCTSKEVKYVS